jgi:acyl carrier protein
MVPMTLEEVVSQVLRCSITDVNDDTSTRTVASWDSLRHIEVVMELEEAFGIAFPPMQAAAMTSVSAIRRVLQQNGIEA